ncbi:hypothetical protein [Okeania sp. SIO3B5]|uniref:hypothetical protein n=1 Tax=Okeania sp. SIO3B5 TaxID=2607811 RepID=UPI0025D74C3F|nr:hypothetical protein [Okeania sp. SIO3B5]
MVLWYLLLKAFPYTSIPVHAPPNFSFQGASLLRLVARFLERLNTFGKNLLVGIGDRRQETGDRRQEKCE